MECGMLQKELTALQIYERNSIKALGERVIQLSLDNIGTEWSLSD